MKTKHHIIKDYISKKTYTREPHARRFIQKQQRHLQEKRADAHAFNKQQKAYEEFNEEVLQPLLRSITDFDMER